MAEVLALAIAFPSVVYTVLLGVVLVYWGFVMVGALHIGEGSEGALDGLDGSIGASKGALEGAAKGVLEAHHADLGDAGGDAGDLGGDADGAGALTALMSALHLRSVPVTVVISLLVTFSWLVSMIGMQISARLFAGAAPGFWSAGLLVLSPLVALPLTSVAARPLSHLFVQRRAPAHRDLVGKVCVVRTGTVTATFGEGVLEDGGAGLVVRVRVDGSAQLKRGQQVLLIEWDDQRDAFVVEPLDEMLRSEKGTPNRP